MRVNLNYLYVLIGQGSNYLFPVFIYPFLITKLGLNSFGIFSLNIVVSQFFLIIMDYGFGYSAAAKINGLSDLERCKYCCKIFGVKIVLFLILFIISLFLFFFADYQLKLILFFSIIICFFSILNILWYLQATSNFKILALFSILSKIITLLLLWYFVDTGDVVLAMALFTIQYLVLALLGLIYLKITGFSFHFFKFDEVFSILKGSSDFFLSNLATSIYTIFTPIILGLVVVKTEIATYNAISVIKQGIAGIIAPLVQVIYSKMVINDIASLVRRDFHKYIRNKIFIIVGIVSVLSFLGVIFSNFISNYIFGYSNEKLILSIVITSLTPILIAFNSSFSTFCLLALGMSKQLFSSVRSASLLCLLLAYPVSLKWGASGVINLLFFIELLVGFLIFFSYQKKIRFGV